MFQASRKEWTELVALLSAVAQGKVPMSTHKGQAHKSKYRCISAVSRQELQGTRHYHREAQTVRIACDGHQDLVFDLDLWQEAAAHAADMLRKSTSESLVDVDDAMEQFLDEAQIQSICGTGEGQHHLVLRFSDGTLGLAGVLSRLGTQPTHLLDGGRAANMKLEQTGTRFATPMAAKVNNIEGENAVQQRMEMITQMGSSLKYVYAANRVFRANLAMIDLHMGRLLTEMLRISYREQVLRLEELLPYLRSINPLKVPTELIEKHQYYEHKLAQLLVACLAGMRPAKIYHGESSLPAFFLLLTPDASVLLFNTANREGLSAFLLSSTKLLRGSCEKDKYGYLERENNVYYFKLNLKIALTKR